MPWTADFTYWQKQNQSCFLQDLPRASPRKWKWNKSWMPPWDTWCEQSGHWAELCSAKDCGENGHKYGTAGFVLLCLHKEFTTCIVPAMIKTWEGVSSASTVLFLTSSFGNFFFFWMFYYYPFLWIWKKKKARWADRCRHLTERNASGCGQTAVATCCSCHLSMLLQGWASHHKSPSLLCSSANKMAFLWPDGYSQQRIEYFVPSSPSFLPVLGDLFLKETAHPSRRNTL